MLLRYGTLSVEMRWMLTQDGRIDSVRRPCCRDRAQGLRKAQEAHKVDCAEYLFSSKPYLSSRNLLAKASYKSHDLDP